MLKTCSDKLPVHSELTGCQETFILFEFFFTKLLVLYTQPIGLLFFSFMVYGQSLTLS